jgi:hypothetical protein
MPRRRPARRKRNPLPPRWGSAAASTDPAVQDLLAARSIAVLNDDQAAITEIDGKLADLGVN